MKVIRYECTEREMKYKQGEYELVYDVYTNKKSGWLSVICVV